MASLLKSILQGEIHLAPNFLTFVGGGAHEDGFEAQIRAVAFGEETAEQNARRQGDIGLVGVFAPGHLQVVDLTVSVGG